MIECLKLHADVPSIVYITLVAIAVTIIMVPYLYVKSLQLIWRCEIYGCPIFKISCKDLPIWQVTRIIVPAIAAGRYVKFNVYQLWGTHITLQWRHNDVIMGAIASQITRLTIVYSIVYSDADQRKQSSASLAFVRGIHRGPHKWPVTRKMFPFDDVIMNNFFRLIFHNQFYTLHL